MIELHLRSGLTYGEMAERLGKSEGALRVQMHRCVRRAQQLLRERLEEDRPTDGSDV